MRFKTAEKFLEWLAKEEIEFIDFRFTDLIGLWHHMTFHRDAVTTSLLSQGVLFDGSSIAGWCGIEASDMLMRPDLSHVVQDPFTSQGTAVVFCDVLDPETKLPYTRDPRNVARKAEEYLKSLGFVDTAYFGPEPEFFLFDDVRFDVGMTGAFYKVDSQEGPYNTRIKQEGGNILHRPGVKGAYFPASPLDHLHDMRSEMLTMLGALGLTPEKHHHEVAPAQHELGFQYSTLMRTGDNLQLYKYAVKNVALACGKTATFLPKPILGDNGSGMHVHQSLFKGDTPLFAGDQYAGLSQNALYYIGGILAHAPALNALTNPTTNSYKRLQPGFEAPVLLAYGARNRSAAIRIPTTYEAVERRIEVRFPDPCANGYLAFAAMLMAGLDGIRNKIEPGEPQDKDLYTHAQRAPQRLSGSLKEALTALDQDRDFLKVGGVFTDDLIDAFITLKKSEIQKLEETPHPIEFSLYYTL